MEYSLVSDHWTSLLREIKDETKQRYKTESLANDILRYIRYTRFRQYNLFTQRRGEEYEKLIAILEESYPKELIERIIQDEEFWKTTLEFGAL